MTPYCISVGIERHRPYSRRPRRTLSTSQCTHIADAPERVSADECVENGAMLIGDPWPYGSMVLAGHEGCQRLQIGRPLGCEWAPSTVCRAARVSRAALICAQARPPAASMRAADRLIAYSSSSPTLRYSAANCSPAGVQAASAAITGDDFFRNARSESTGLPISSGSPQIPRRSSVSQNAALGLFVVGVPEEYVSPRAANRRTSVWISVISGTRRVENVQPTAVSIGPYRRRYPWAENTGRGRIAADHARSTPNAGPRLSAEPWTAMPKAYQRLTGLHPREPGRDPREQVPELFIADRANHERLLQDIRGRAGDRTRPIAVVPGEPPQVSSVCRVPPRWP